MINKKLLFKVFKAKFIENNIISFVSIAISLIVEYWATNKIDINIGYFVSMYILLMSMLIYMDYRKIYKNG